MKDMRGGDSPSRLALFRAVCPLVFIAVSLFAAVPCAPAGPTQDAGAGGVKVVYDEQKDVTQIILNPIVLVSRKYEELRLGAAAAYKGRVKAQPKEVALVFLSLTRSDANKYETARRLTVSADGRQFALGETQRTKQAQGGLFVESMAVVIPSDTFLRICRAKEVTMKLGFTEVKLSPAQIGALSVAAGYMTPD